MATDRVDGALLAALAHGMSAMEPGSFGLQLNTGNEYVNRLRERLVAAAVKALPDVDAGRFDVAEAALQAIDRDIQAAVTLGAMYTHCLRDAVRRGERRTRPQHVSALYEHALRWRLASYPEPHTSYEADSYSSGQSSDRAELDAVLESDPS